MKEGGCKRGSEIIHWSLFLLFIVASFSLVACRSQEETSQSKNPIVTVETVEVGDVPTSIELVGQTSGSVDVEIRARVEGELVGVHFAEGKMVEQGALLYTIDPQPFDAKVVEARSKLAEAETKWVAAEIDLKRIRPLAEIDAVSKRDLDAAAAREGAAKSVVDAARAALQLAEIERGYTEITAPVAGLIGISRAKVGELVGSTPDNSVLNTISQLDPIHVRVAIPEKDYLKLARILASKKGKGSEQRNGSPVELHLADGTVHPHSGVLHAVDNQIDSRTGSLAIELAFPNPERILRPGQFAKIKAITSTMENALLVPQRAVQELQGRYQVFTLNDDNIVEARAVKLGPKSGDKWVVDEGVSQKDRIIVDGFQRVRPGMEVEPTLSAESSEKDS